MTTRATWLACASLISAMLACSKKDDASTSAPPTPPPKKAPGLEFVGTPVEQDADFPKERWVRTVLFDGKTSYIGFTYVDRSKGNSIKGEEVEGLSPAEIKARLHADFPSSTMQPIPAGHPMTLLTPEEIAEYDLPAAPDWLSYFK